jgi:hypothetical protein
MMMIMIMKMMIMEGADPSETSVLFNQTTQRDMPENSYLKYQLFVLR